MLKGCPQTPAMKRPRKRLLLMLLIAVLVIARLSAPALIKSRINQAIAADPKVTGAVEDVDLWLLSGRVSLDDLALYKANAEIPVPILSARSVVFSLSWRDLIRGRLFGDVTLVEPVLNLVDGKRAQQTQTGAEIDWRAALTELYPMDINQLVIKRGAVHFRNFQSDPPVDLYLESIALTARNLTNELRVEDARVASIELTGTTIGGGRVTAETTFNLIREPARASIQLSISELPLTALNPLTRAYANLDVQSGQFSMTGDLRLTENQTLADLDGELRPLATQLNVLRWREDAQIEGDSVFMLTWEGLVDAIKFLLEAGPQDRLETTIPISGSLSEPDLGTLTATWGLIRNAVSSWFGGDD